MRPKETSPRFAVCRIEPPEQRVYAKMTAAEDKMTGRKLKSDAGAVLAHIDNVMPVDEAVALCDRLAQGRDRQGRCPCGRGLQRLSVSP